MTTSYVLNSIPTSFGVDTIPRIASKQTYNDQLFSWDQQSSQMAHLHIINASTFYMFQANVLELRRTIDRMDISTSNTIVNGISGSNLSGLQRLSHLICDRHSEYKRLSQQSEKLVTKSYTVAPVYMRHAVVQRETKVVSLCDYEVSDTFIMADETLTLINNNDPFFWTVKKANNKTVSVPSVTCLIPGPDRKLIEVARLLQTFLLDKWKQELVYIKKVILNLLESICTGISNNEIQIAPQLSSELRTLLTQIVDDIFYDDDEGISNEINEKQEMAKFLQMYSVCCDHLSNINFADKHPWEHMKSQIDVNAIFDIRLIISTFKDLVRSCHRLAKQADGAQEEKDSIRPSNQTDVEKLFDRLSLASNESTTLASDGFDENGSYRKKCISRLYLSISKSRYEIMEKFVDTAEIKYGMPVSIVDNTKYRSSVNIMLQRNDNYLTQNFSDFSVKYFEITPFSLEKSVKSTQYSPHDTWSVDYQDVEITDQFNLIENVKVNTLYSSAPPVNASETCHTFTQTLPNPNLAASYTQTLFKLKSNESSLAEDDVSSKDLMIYSSDQNVSETIVRSDSQRRLFTVPVPKVSSKTVQTDLTEILSRTEIEREILLDRMNSLQISPQDFTVIRQIDVENKFTQSEFFLNLQEKLTQTEEEQSFDKSVETDSKVQSDAKNQTSKMSIIDENIEYAPLQTTRDCQTLSSIANMRNGGSQTGDLSYEVVTRVLIEGEHARNVEVLSVVWKSGEDEF